MHLLRQEHLETMCPNCRTVHDKQWSSEWNIHEHYESIKCQVCSYKIQRKTEHLHSGHIPLLQERTLDWYVN